MPENQGDGARPSRELTFQKDTQQGLIGANKDNAANSPSTSLTQEQQSWYDRPEEELASAFRQFIKARSQRTGGFIPDEEIVRQKLELEATSVHLPASAPREDEESAQNFFFTLRNAFDAVAYDHYEPGSHAADMAGASLHYLAGQKDHGPIIKLTDPLQVKIMNAMTEAVGIPYKKGQTEIHIADKLRGRNYTSMILSEEYQDRVSQAKANRKK